MKQLLLVVLTIFCTQAFAQKHMVEFNAESVLLGTFSLNTQKNSGEHADHSTMGMLFLNYAYTVAPQIQLGAQGTYNKANFTNNENENYELLVGAIYNLSTDLRNSIYASLYAGYSWENVKYDSNFFDDERGEAIKSRFALGKRFALTMLNLENVTYSPEVSFTNENATKRTTAQWEQNISFKFLQFSVLF